MSPLVRLRPLVPLPPRQAATVRLEAEPGLLRLRGPRGERVWRVGADVDGAWWDEERDTVVLARRGTAVGALAGGDWGRRHLRDALAVVGLPPVGPPDGAARAVDHARSGWLPRALPVTTVVATVGVLSPALALLLLGTGRVLSAVVDDGTVERYLAVAHAGWGALCAAALVWVWTVMSPLRPVPRPTGQGLAAPPRRRGPGSRARLLRDDGDVVVRTDDGLELRLPLEGPQRVAGVGLRCDAVLPGGAGVVLCDAAEAPLVTLPVEPWWRDERAARQGVEDLAATLGVPRRDALPDPTAPVVGVRPGARDWHVLGPVVAVVLSLTAVVPLVAVRTSPLPLLTVALAVALLASLVVAAGLRVREGRRVPGDGQPHAPDGQPQDLGGFDVRDPAALDPGALPADLAGGGRRPGPLVLLVPVAVGLLGLYLASSGAGPEVPAWREPVGALLVAVACLAQAVLLVLPVLAQERRRRALLRRPDVVAVARPGGLWGPRALLLAVPDGLVEVEVAHGPVTGVRTGPGAVERLVLPTGPTGERGDLLLATVTGEVLLVLAGGRWFPSPASRRASADALLDLGLVEAADDGSPYVAHAAPRSPGPGAVAGALLVVAPFAGLGLLAVVLGVGGSLAPLVTASGTLVLVAAAVAAGHLVADEVTPRDAREHDGLAEQEVW